MNYPVPTRHDTQSTCEILSTFDSTDCLSEVSSYVYPIEVNGSRDDLVRISEANQPETCRDTYEREIVRIGQRQIADTKRLDQ